jgi:hypothetical protein
MQVRQFPGNGAAGTSSFGWSALVDNQVKAEGANGALQLVPVRHANVQEAPSLRAADCRRALIVSGLIGF